MFDYDAESVKNLFKEIVRNQVNEETWLWLEDKFLVPDTKTINSAFAMMPRKTGKSLLVLSASNENDMERILPGFSLKNWTLDRLARICLLLHINPNQKEKYLKTIDDLFLAAEVQELVALYAALPLFAWPEDWKMRCAEGIRSNIGLVLEAIMYHNSYPKTYLDEKAWNQLVLKAFFTDKDLNKIVGLDERANPDLAATLVDYAHERWAAHRSINPHLWRLTTKFINQDLLIDLQRLLESGNLNDRQAAALCIYHSDFEPAKLLLNKYPELIKAIENKELNWSNFTPEA